MKVNFAAPKKLTITLILSGIFLLIFSGMALSEENETNEDPGYVEVFEVSGLLDDVLADALENAIHDAQRNGANGLILQVNSTYLDSILYPITLFELYIYIGEKYNEN